MRIFFWFLIIAIATLTLNLIVIRQMKKQKSIHVISVVAILVAGYLAAALLYLFTAMHGTQILEEKKAVSFDIETESYRTAVGDAHTSYAFCSREGIPFSFNDTELLTDDVPKDPSVVEVYICKTRTGYSSCYLSEGTAVRYILR